MAPNDTLVGVNAKPRLATLGNGAGRIRVMLGDAKDSTLAACGLVRWQNGKSDCCCNAVQPRLAIAKHIQQSATETQCLALPYDKPWRQTSRARRIVPCAGAA